MIHYLSSKKPKESQIIPDASATPEQHPSNPGKDESYFSSRSDGAIVLSQTVMNTPIVSESSVEKVSYVPKDFAQSAIHRAETENEDLRIKYEQHIQQLKEFYERNMDRLKVHYEGYIVEVKAKARRYVQIQRDSKQNTETSFNTELGSANDLIEELRDAIASLRRESQEAHRQFHIDLTAADERAKGYRQKLQQVVVVSECKNLMHDMINEVEREHTTSWILQRGSEWAHTERQLRKAMEEMKMQSHRNMIERVTDMNRKLAEAVEKYEMLSLQSTCRSALDSIVSTIENNQQQISAAEYTSRLHELESVLAESENARVSLDSRHRHFLLQHETALVESKDMYQSEASRLKSVFTQQQQAWDKQIVIWEERFTALNNMMLKVEQSSAEMRLTVSSQLDILRRQLSASQQTISLLKQKHDDEYERLQCEVSLQPVIHFAEVSHLREHASQLAVSAVASRETEEAISRITNELERKERILAEAVSARKEAVAEAVAAVELKFEQQITHLNEEIAHARSYSDGLMYQYEEKLKYVSEEASAIVARAEYLNQQQEEKIMALEEQVTASAATIQDLSTRGEERLKVLEDEICTLKTEKTSINSDYATKINSLDEETAIIKAKLMQMSNFEEQLKELQENLADRNALVVQYERRIAELAEEARRLRDELFDLNKQYSNKISELERELLYAQAEKLKHEEVVRDAVVFLACRQTLDSIVKKVELESAGGRSKEIIGSRNKGDQIFLNERTLADRDAAEHALMEENVALKDKVKELELNLSIARDKSSSDLTEARQRPISDPKVISMPDPSKYESSAEFAKAEAEAKREMRVVAIQKLTAEIAKYEEAFDRLRVQEDEAMNSISEMSILRADFKKEIKKWMRTFEKENNRPPESKDKELVKDKFQAFQDVQLRITDMQRKVEEYAREKDEVNDNLQRARYRLEDLRAEEGPAPKLGSLLSSKSFRGSFKSAVKQSKEEDLKMIEDLEDQLVELHANYETVLNQAQKLQSENLFLSTQLDAFTKEKRSDIVKQFEIDLKDMKERYERVAEALATAKAAKVKAELLASELQERVKRAEDELKDRDARELSELTPTEEKAVLKQQIGKQRTEITMKAKAATAGWDAAASAEERLEIRVEKAYSEGLKEGRARNQLEWDQLSAAVAVKDDKITELMVAVLNMEKKVRESEEVSLKAVRDAQQAKEDASEAITQFALGGASSPRPASRSGGGNGGGVTSSGEVGQVRRDLEAAQEELVVLSDKCSEMDVEIKILDEKVKLYVKLLSDKEADILRIEAGRKEILSKAVLIASEPEIATIMQIVKDALAKGSALLKTGKKDDCFFLFTKTLDEVQPRIRSEEWRAALANDVTNAKHQSGPTARTKGVDILKKTLANLLADCQKIPTLTAEEIKDGAPADASSVLAQAEAASNALQNQLLLVDRQLDATRKARLSVHMVAEATTDDRSVVNAAKSSSEAELQVHTQGSASLLRRAKVAEGMVEALKKQLASALLGGGDIEGRSKDGGGGEATRDGAFHAAETRKYHRQIKDLEKRLRDMEKSSAGEGSNGGVAAEKQVQKKMRELESAYRKEKTALENRAIKAETLLETAHASLPALSNERDRLKNEAAEMTKQLQELEHFRILAAKGAELEKQLEVRNADFGTLQELFNKEAALRKKYKNKLEDLKGNIRVYARCRPLAKYELEKGCNMVVKFPDEGSVKVAGTRGEKSYEFDTVFSPIATNEQVFEEARQLVESCVDGFNVCVFAYGQTGSGKTFTMTGTPDTPGLTPGSIRELFNVVAARAHCTFKISAYFVELYMDSLIDLFWILDRDQGPRVNSNASLEPPKLEVFMDERKMVMIRNAVVKEILSADQLMELFNQGNLKRHVGATRMNAESSRSHSIFSIMIESFDKNSKKKTVGKLSMVDLAGSERADKTGAGQDRLKEAQSINKSLSTLGDVIAALSEGSKFVPYRNNKLTLLMQDSLGGNAKTLMFVNFSPADYNSDETVSSLNYAARVKKIVNSATKQTETDEVAKLRAIIQRLRSGDAVGEGDRGEEEEADNETDATAAASALDAERAADDAAVYE